MKRFIMILSFLAVIGAGSVSANDAVPCVTGQPAPMIVGTEPEQESFFLKAAEFDTVTICFSMPVYTGYDGVCLWALDPKFQLPFDHYADVDCKNLVFTVPYSLKEKLKNRVRFLVINAFAMDLKTGGISADSVAVPQDFFLSFGAPDLNNLTGLALEYYEKMEEALNSLQEMLIKCEEGLDLYGRRMYDNLVYWVHFFSITDFFNGSHTAPSDFDSMLNLITSQTKTIENYMNLVDRAEDALRACRRIVKDYAQLADYKYYQEVKRLVDQADLIDYEQMSNDELSVLCKERESIIDTAFNNLMTIDVKTRQLRSLSLLNSALGVFIEQSLADSVNACTDDNPILVTKLKHAASEAIEALRSSGVSDVQIDMTGFIDNYSLYSTGELNRDVIREYYVYEAVDRYRIRHGTGLSSILPGWEISNSTGSVMCGFNPDNGIFEMNYGGYVEPGFAIEAAVCADWESDFKLTQTVEGLPNGIYTLSVSYGAGVNDVNNQYLEANGIRRAASSRDNAYFAEQVVIEKIPVTDGTLSITAYHAASSSWARLDNFSLKLTSLVTVESDNAIFGDADKDGKVSASDFMMVADYIVDSSFEGSISLDAADVNHSGTITVADLTGIANIVLYGSPAGVGQPDGVGDAVSLHVHPFVVQNSSETCVDVSIANGRCGFSAYQFDVCLPKGVSVADVRLNGMRVSSESENVFMHSRLEDGCFRVLFASVSATNVEGSDGVVVTMVLKADESLAEGEYEMLIDNIELSRDAISICPGSCAVPFSCNMATGIKYGYGPDKGSYSISGQKLEEPHHGINIIDGHKVLR